MLFICLTHYYLSGTTICLLGDRKEGAKVDKEIYKKIIKMKIPHTKIAFPMIYASIENLVFSPRKFGILGSNRNKFEVN